MDRVLNFQISLFGSFRNIQPDALLTSKITEALSEDDFVPSIVVASTIDSVNKKVITENRLRMETKDHSWSIVFLAERIDINYVCPSQGVFYSDVKTVTGIGKRLCEKVFSPISETTGVRMAVNGRFMLKDMEPNKKQDFIKRFVIVPKVFGSNPVTEWNARFNSPTEIVFGDKKDICNYILEVYDIVTGVNPNNQEVVSRVAVGLDINTSQFNNEQKYNYSDILCFADAAGRLIESTLEEIEEKT